MRGVTHNLGYGILGVKKGGIWEIGSLDISGKKRWDMGDFFSSYNSTIDLKRSSCIANRTYMNIYQI